MSTSTREPDSDNADVGITLKRNGKVSELGAFPKFFGGDVYAIDKAADIGGGFDGDGGRRKFNFISRARKSLCARSTHGQCLLRGVARLAIRRRLGIRGKLAEKSSGLGNNLCISGQYDRRVA